MSSNATENLDAPRGASASAFTPRDLPSPTAGDIVIETSGLGKAYFMYQRPEDRLKQMLWRNRRRYYNEFWAFQNVDLTIRRGETVGIVGRNGSGKSTLLQVIAGTLQPTTGTVAVKGRSAPLLELGAGFNPEFTGRENVRLAASILGLSEDVLEARFPDILTFAGVGDFIDQPVKTYSSGMYARLAFAVAAHVDADILIVDEILSVGDAAFVQKCMRWIRDFQEWGTLLFVSHDTAAVVALCDRAVWMDKGQIRADGDPRDVTLAYQAAGNAGVDGSSFTVEGRRRTERIEVRRDFRHKQIAASDKSNVLEVFDFDPEAPSFGARGGMITEVTLLNSDGANMPSINGGEVVVLQIEASANVALEAPIIGFFVRDRLGQNLFGDNTYLSYAHEDISISAGERLRASFEFQMPYLPAGEYSVTVALADGTQFSGTSHHWVDEALIFTSHTSHVTGGLIGIPINRIAIEKIIE